MSNIDVNPAGALPAGTPVGTVEIAALLGVSRKAVDNWRTRLIEPRFPDPVWSVGGRPAWRWKDVREWASATGRL